jgi:hypothetical protein
MGKSKEATERDMARAWHLHCQRYSHSLIAKELGLRRDTVGTYLTKMSERLL